MIIDSFTISALLVAIGVIIVAVLLTIHKTNTDKKMRKMAKQFTLIQHNEKAQKYSKLIAGKHPELCAGIDYTLKVNGDDVEIEEWNTEHPQPRAE